MSTALIQESISALSELLDATVQDESLSGSCELSKEVSNKIEEVLKISQKGVLLKELAGFFTRIAKANPKAAQAIESIEMTFEVGPQYNDEGYDLRVTYESGIDVKVVKGKEEDIYSDLDDMFHNWIYGALSPQKFQGWFSKPISLDYHNTMTVYIDSPEDLFEVLAKNSDPLVKDFTKHLYITVESSKADTY